jgi:putative ABC transport system permease protein
MDTLLLDLRSAARGLLRSRGVALLSIVTLAVGIGATTAMFSVVHAALLRPPPFDEPGRLLILFNTQLTPRDGLQRLRWSWRNVTALQAAATSFEAVASFTGPVVAISNVDPRSGEALPPEQTDGEIVSSAYLRALRVTPIAGRGFGPEDDTPGSAQPLVLISARLWQRRFSADPKAVGSTLRVNDVPLTVVGVLPEGFAGLSGKAELWISPPTAARATYPDYLTTPQNFISVVARLKEGVTLERANAELAVLGPRFAGEDAASGSVWGALAVRLGDARVDATVRRSALALLAAAACVLLVACVNVASLLLARAHNRRREMAVRLAIGSSRGRLIRQLLTEGLLLAALAGAAGVLLSLLGMDLIASTAPPPLPSFRNYYGAVSTFGRPELDGNVLLFALLVSLLTTLFFALAPALQASRAPLGLVLKQDARGGARHGATFSVLVVAEVALASLLLTGSGWLLDGFARLQGRRAGFVSERVVTFWVRPPSARYNYPADGPAILERLLTRLQTVPGVESVAANRCTPFSGCSRSIVFFPDRPADPGNAPGVGRHYVSPDYFRTLGIPLLSGRFLSDTDRAGAPPVALVNQAGARRFWPGADPIGKRVWFGTTTGPFSDAARAVEIVGVVGDVKYEGGDQPEPVQRADFYTSYRQFSYPDSMFLVKAQRPAAALVPELRQAVASVDAALPIYDVMTLDERIDSSLARPRFNTALLGAFAAVALVLAALGVYGVLSYSVSSRVREIGVRVALGADAGRVVALVLAQGMRLALLGAALGLLGALVASRFVQGLVVGASTSGPLVPAASLVLMLGVAAAAAFVPARRASSVDPMQVLRHE